MTMRDAHDPMDVALAGVTPLVPNRSRTDAVRRRCRAQLARRTADSRRRNAARGSWATVVVTVVLALFSALYAAALLSTTLRLEGWLP
jgi:hypothetical protein